MLPGGGIPVVSAVNSGSKGLRQWKVNFQGSSECLVKVKGDSSSGNGEDYYLLDSDESNSCKSNKFNFRFGIKKELGQVYAQAGKISSISGPLGVELITKKGSEYKKHDGQLVIRGNLRVVNSKFKKSEKLDKKLTGETPFLVMMTNGEGNFWIVGMPYSWVKTAIFKGAWRNDWDRGNWNQKLNEFYTRNKGNISLRAFNKTISCIELFDFNSVDIGTGCKSLNTSLESSKRKKDSNEVTSGNNLSLVIMPADQIRLENGKLKIGSRYEWKTKTQLTSKLQLVK